MTQLAWRIADAAKAAGVSRSTLYDEIRQGRLQAIKIGRATRIRCGDLQAWLGSRPLIKPKGGTRFVEHGRSDGRQQPRA